MIKLLKKDSMNYKRDLLIGTKSALLAFIIVFICSLLMAVVINFSEAMEFIKAMLIGTLKDDGGTSLGRIIKMTIWLMNASLFASFDKLHIGLLVLSVIPVLSLLFSQRKVLKKGFSMDHAFILLVTSLVFSTLVTLISFTTKGSFFGKQFQMASLFNFLWFILFTFITQFAIMIQFNKVSPGYIQATRHLLRLLLLAGSVFAIVEMFLIKIPIHFIYKVLLSIVALPNLIIYKALVLMGNDIHMSYTVAESYDQLGNLRLSNSELPIAFRIISVAVFCGFIIWALFKIDKNQYWKNVLPFSVIFSGLWVLLAMIVTIRTDVISFIGEVTMEYSLGLVFFIPFLVCVILGLILWMVRKLVEVIKEF